MGGGCDQALWEGRAETLIGWRQGADCGLDWIQAPVEYYYYQKHVYACLYVTCGKKVAWGSGCCREETRLETETGTICVDCCKDATGTVGRLAERGSDRLLGSVSW